MGFFDKILQGLGFEGEDGEEKKPIPQKKEKIKKQKTKNTYILNADKKIKTDIIEVAPKTQEEICKAIDFLKNKTTVRIDFSFFSNESLYRAIDFIQGACYVLDIIPTYESEKIFLLKP